MIARKETKTITMKQDQEELIEERVGQQQQPERGNFACRWTGKRNGHMRLMKLPRKQEWRSKVITRSFKWRCTIVWQA